MTLDPKKSVFRSEEPRPKRVIRRAIMVSLLAVAATLGVVFYSINAKDVVPLYFAIGCWAIGPPAWFWYEYYWLYCKYGEPDTLEYSSMAKTCQRPSGLGYWRVLSLSR